MGAIAEAIAAYAQPLIDATDGSLEAVNDALSVSQLCWNIAILPKVKQDEALSGVGLDLEMQSEEFETFRQSVLIPMIRRHEEMFPQLHVHFSTDHFQADPSDPTNAAPKERYPGTEPYAPCPCNSGRKYKFCCRAKKR